MFLRCLCPSMKTLSENDNIVVKLAMTNHQVIRYGVVANISRSPGFDSPYRSIYFL